MKRILAEKGLRDFAGTVNLTMSHMGQIADVIEAAGSVDETGTYVFEVPAKTVEKSTSKEAAYWNTASGTDTMASFWNSSEKIEDIVITISFLQGKGKYKLPVNLDPHASYNLDMMQLIAAQRPDKDGNMIPMSATEGGFVFASADGVTAPMYLNANVGIFNVADATCYYGCITCSGYYDLYVSPNPLNLPITWQNYYMEAMGEYSDGSDDAVSGSWTSSNSSVAPISSNGYVSGNEGGTATLAAVAELPDSEEFCAYNPACYEQPEEEFQASGGTTVQTPTSISGPTLSAISTYSNQTLKNCVGTVVANNFYGVSRCGTYTIMDQNGKQIEMAGLKFNENLTVTDTNANGSASPTTGATNGSYQLVDFYASGQIGAPLPAGSYTYIVQTITYAGTNQTVRVNCIANLVSTITVTNVTTASNPASVCHH